MPLEIDPKTGAPIVTGAQSSGPIKPFEPTPPITGGLNPPVTIPHPPLPHPTAGEPIPSVSDVHKEPAVKGLDTTQAPVKPNPPIEKHAFIEVHTTNVNEIPDKLNQIQGILKESGADSASQIKGIARIKEVLGW